MDLGRVYPRDVFPGVWESIETLVVEGRAVIPREVLDELERHDPDAYEWAKGLDDFVVEPDDHEIAIVAEIAENHPDWVQGRKNAADPFVVANASGHGRIVVTHERRRGPGVLDHNLGIPNVADEYDLECISLQELARREQWQFKR
ncbi:MAG: hypothetical protein DCC49_02230 [Acidobacteria bacterium]|nr:MAG: hypothetical protein DCC49_02230 [Acidobacteriota bacterium]